MKDAKGFSLIELIVTIAIIAILLAIAVPGFMKWLPDYHLKEAVNDLRSNFEQARVLAIKKSTNCAIKFTKSGGQYTGYVIFLDEDGNFIDSAGDPSFKDSDVTTVLFSSYSSVSFDKTTFYDADKNGNPSLPTFAFQPTGIPAQANGNSVNAFVQLKNTNGKTSSVYVTAAGVVRIQ